MTTIATPKPGTKVPPSYGAFKVDTIADAKKLYREYGANAVHAGFRSLVETISVTGHADIIENRSYFEALFLSEVMIHRTNRTFRMLSGATGDGFLTMLEKPLREMLHRMREEGSFAKVILLRDEGQVVDAGSMQFLAKLKQDYPAVFDFRSGSVSESVPHFMVADSKMLRLEDCHKCLSDSSPDSAVTARIHFSAAAVARSYEVRFDAFWGALHK